MKGLGFGAYLRVGEGLRFAVGAEREAKDADDEVEEECKQEDGKPHLRCTPKCKRWRNEALCPTPVSIEVLIHAPKHNSPMTFTLTITAEDERDRKAPRKNASPTIACAKNHSVSLLATPCQLLRSAVDCPALLLLQAACPFLRSM